MRPLLCLLVLLSVLAPVGEVGITATPADAETQLVTPRPERGAITARSLITCDVAVVVTDSLAPRLGDSVRRMVVPGTRTAHGYLLERTVGARAPPV